MTGAIQQQIHRGAEKGQKSYGYADQHDASRPADLWFIRPGDAPLVNLLEQFNQSQDFSLLSTALQPRP
jgi:hypothetical protein